MQLSGRTCYLHCLPFCTDGDEKCRTIRPREYASLNLTRSALKIPFPPAARSPRIREIVSEFLQIPKDQYPKLLLNYFSVANRAKTYMQQERGVIHMVTKDRAPYRGFVRR